MSTDRSAGSSNTHFASVSSTPTIAICVVRTDYRGLSAFKHVGKHNFVANHALARDLHLDENWHEVISGLSQLEHHANRIQGQTLEEKSDNFGLKTLQTIMGSRHPNNADIRYVSRTEFDQCTEAAGWVEIPDKCFDPSCVATSR